MPLQLPPGLVVTPIVSDLNVALAGPRVTSYRFDILDNDEHLVGTLGSVAPGGSVDWTARSSIKGGGSIDVTDIHQDIDFLKVRIRPMALLSRAGVFDPVREVPCGVFIPSAPVQKWTATGRAWTIELLDKCSLLDQDVYVDGSGNAVAYTAPIGANVVDTVKTLIVGAGETVQAILPGTKTLTSAQVWDAGTTRLKIINDLLDTANYFSLWCDGSGQFRVTPYQPPGERPPVYDLLTPFSKGPNSLMSPQWTLDRDLYSVPNRVVAIGQGDGAAEAWVSTASNTDPASPFSYSSRGRWITEVITGVEVTGQADLDAYALRNLHSRTSVSMAIKVEHIFLPDLTVNSTVRFVNPDAGLDIKCSVQQTTIKFDPIALCSSNLLEAFVE